MRSPDRVEMMPPSLPRPGKALKIVLIVIAVASVLGAMVVNWAPGPPAGPHWFSYLTMIPSEVIPRVWTLVTSGILTNPQRLSHVLFTLIGLYFLTPDLEKRWGGLGLVRFLVLSVVAGNLLVLAFDKLAPTSHPIFHPGVVYGAGSALAGTAIAWSKMNARMQVRLFFFVPVSGRALFWVTIAFCVLGLVYYESVPEGAVAPFAGVAVGILLSGSPSPIRSLWLRLKLKRLQKKAGGGLDVESLAGDLMKPAKKARRPGAPALRVVSGGLEDELKNKKPPKDKRYLN